MLDQPDNGRTQFNALSREEEVQIGTQGKAEMLPQFGGEVPSAELRAYTDRIGRSLLPAAIEKDKTLEALPWEFTLLNSDVINAFALPGGKVFMSRGLAAKMTNEAQFAGVIGHEIAHVAARHTNDRFARAAGAQIGVAILGAVVGSAAGIDVSGLAGQFTQLALMSYDREQENESDKFGMVYMVKAGYDPAGMRQVMEILRDASGDQSPPEFLSTHPLPESRIRIISERIQKDYAHTQNNPAFQLHEARYRQQFLNRLAALPPAPEDGARALARAAAAMRALGGCEESIDLARPETWCGVCRAAAAERALSATAR